MYPNQLPLETLESKNAEYEQMLPALNEIDLLVSGGFRLKNAIRHFLQQRVGEENEVYETRLKKFTYLNILSSSINEQVSKLANAPMTIEGLDVNPKFWSAFRENTDLSGRSEKNLITLIFRELLKFKKVYLHVDKPKSEVAPINKLQEEALGLRPYIVTYSPLQVTNWSESKGKLNWLKIRQVSEDDSNPIAAPRKVCTWTIIDSNYIAKYSAIVELDGQGNITKVNAEMTNADTTISLVSLIPHGFNQVPVLKIELPDQLWVADQAASKAVEHLRTDCSKYDLLTMSYFQRTFKRSLKPDGDLENSYEDDVPPPTGLQHVIEVDQFQWAEPKGDIIKHMAESLKAIEAQVRDLVSSGGVSSSNGAIAQSGVSKQMDFTKQETMLKSYGELLVDAYQDLLQLVAKSAGIDGRKISVTGLNSFENDSLDSMLVKLDSVSKLNVESLKANLPPSALKVVYEQMVSLLAGSLSASQKEQVNKEIEVLMNTINTLDTSKV
ncbi:MAG: hypothetical protein RMZ41_001760 [Nostoc sp. DedVER02]|uniref:hypothetical protein n=1 Tax=unclassified Nostoc TaxID=2593658 RepID=UPI002AD4FDDF|nr:MULTISPECIES: hypothetical protein [unclassified Nostoc]MDZ7987115.1 hypothetical protein [Nostoc sp. DedVER02]MDZ8111015.1 hypothetical protein [Nostoc sp. DedVER01b]